MSRRRPRRLAALLLGAALPLTGAGSTPAGAEEPTFAIARVQYDGGGDWYADPSSLPNLLRFARQEAGLAVDPAEGRLRLTDEELTNHPYLYLTGHGNILFTEREVRRLRAWLEAGGFLHADDNYGMDESFRREMSRVFPTREFVELPASHAIFRAPFPMTAGLPKVHEHDGKRPQALGLFHEGRLCVLYTYEADLGDGWEDAEVHDVPAETRRAALRMGTNILVYALTH